MKDTEFLELLNLYLDHEISAADAARLEAEVQANPDRRRVYHDYCRMQKACTVLAKEFAEQPAEPKVIAFEPRRTVWSSGWFAVGGLAAAACLALVLVNRQRTAAPSGASPEQMVVVVPSPTALAESAVSPSPAIPVARMVTTAPERRVDSRALLASMPPTVAPANAEPLVANAQPNTRPQFEWMHDVQLAPIQRLPMDALRLDARSPLQPASRTYSNGRATEGTVEMTAFKFSR